MLGFIIMVKICKRVGTLMGGWRGRETEVEGQRLKAIIII